MPRPPTCQPPWISLKNASLVNIIEALRTQLWYKLGKLANQPQIINTGGYETIREMF